MTTAVTVGLAFLLACAFAACWPLLGHLDNHTGGDMTASGHWTTRGRILTWLGITHLIDYAQQQEDKMSEITDALNRLAQQVNGVSAAQATSFHNLQVAIDELKAGKLTAEQQEIVTRIEGALTKLGQDAEAGDDGFEPTPEPEQPEAPVDEQPTTPGVEVPPADQPVDTDTPDDGTARRR